MNLFGQSISHVVHLSGGITSYAAARRLANRGVPMRLLFADTIIEANDTYRFLIEGAADISGIRRSNIGGLLWDARDLPLLEGGEREFREQRLEQRKNALYVLRRKAMDAIHSLIWIADGRTPFEVFADEKYLGNSRVDPCSKILKRQLLDRWCNENCDDDTVHYFGLDWTEPGRLDRFRRAMAGRRVDFPMAQEPFLTKVEVIAESMARGIEPPSLYIDGNAHGNCGGACIKAGQKQAALLLRTNPRYYGWWEDSEQDMREWLDRDVSILRSRKGGKTTTLTLRVLRQQIESGQGCDESDRGACNCFEVEKEDV